MFSAPSASDVLLEDIRQLVNAVAMDQLPLRTVRLQMCRLLQVHFGVDRASMWRFRTAPDGQYELHCVALHTAAADTPAQGALLSQREFTEYFRCLMVDGLYASADVLSDPCLNGLKTYFQATGVRATLDAAFRVNGQARGIVCVEQLSAPRQWTAGEQALLRRIAARLSVAVSRMKPVPPAGPSLAD